MTLKESIYLKKDHKIKLLYEFFSILVFGVMLNHQLLQS